MNDRITKMEQKCHFESELFSFSIRALSSGEISLLYILSTVYPIFTSILTLSVCLQFFQVFLTSNKSSAIKGHSNVFFFKWLVMILNRWCKVNIRWKPSGFHSPQPEKQLLGNLKKKIAYNSPNVKKKSTGEGVNRNVQRKTYGIFLKNPFV